MEPSPRDSVPGSTPIDEMLRNERRLTLRSKLPALAKRGFTQADAARELGVSRQRVSQVVAALGLTFTPSVRAVPRAKERLRELAKKGLTRTEASRELGVSLERITRLAAQHGVTFAAVWSRPRAPKTELGRILQRARLAAGYGYTRLGTLSGLHRQHIAAIELGRVRRPTRKTLRALANSFQGRPSYDELTRAAHRGKAPAKRRRSRSRGRSRAATRRR